ncbi:glutamate mutase L [Pseudonocardia abyssalis]|uniref:Glutamate mutase L n=2 Tax=Pseudonocardia abyssalis TaxID=2792008 RepID=A0ABS6UUR2_9PSEU|nr:glutamate mutase L [Pseudonocardia abyssalis]MBW0135995.1 glutamate mutase L [Pseudonocardia abyssalis]
MTPARSHVAAAVCLDVGSTWTKAVLVHPDGGLAGFAEHPTTTGDVLAGMDATVRAVSAVGGSAHEPELLACSSAGGGLRLAVVGSDRLTATEAGHRVAVSAGAHVVHVHAGPLEPADVRALRNAKPGVVLLLGGSDGDDPAPLLHNAGRLARARIRPPILLAGNVDGRAEALATLLATGRTVVSCENVLPRLGEVVPGPARAALVSLYQRHAIGGRGPAVAPRFRRLVRVVTADAVGRGVAELARIRRGRVLLVDVGCATTEVHSADGRDGVEGGARRTVEGDLGVRAAAGGVLLEGQAEGVVDPVEADLLAPTVARMASEVGFVPSNAGGAAEDRRIAALASVVAVRRHLRADAGAAEGIGLVVLTGGVFRQRGPGNGLAAVIATLRSDPVLAAALADVEVVVDSDFTVAPAGLLATHGRTDAAESLLRDHLLG